MAARRIGSEYLTPLYSQADVAHIVSASPSTVQRWIAGYRQGTTEQPPIIDVVRPGRGDTVPFIGLAEVFVVNAFRKAGLPLQRIRPAVEVLKNKIGIEFALANNRLLTDGADILWRSDDDSDQRLVVLKNGNAVFNEVVADYLHHIDFGEFGYAESLRLPQYTGLTVRVDPRFNGGRPTLSTRGIAVDDVLGRVRAGEPPREVAEDYGLATEDVLNLNRLAA